MNRTFDLDKRRYIRYEILDYAQVWVSTMLEPQNAVIVDIGLGGLQLRSRAEFPIGAKCKLHLGREDKPPVVLPGEVRHSLKVPDSDLTATGVRFLPKTHEDRLAIAEYVHTVFQRQCDLLVP